MRIIRVNILVQGVYQAIILYTCVSLLLLKYSKFHLVVTHIFVTGNQILKHLQSFVFFTLKVYMLMLLNIDDCHLQPFLTHLVGTYIMLHFYKHTLLGCEGAVSSTTLRLHKIEKQCCAPLIYTSREM